MSADPAEHRLRPIPRSELIDRAKMCRSALFPQWRQPSIWRVVLHRFEGAKPANSASVKSPGVLMKGAIRTPCSSKAPSQLADLHGIQLSGKSH